MHATANRVRLARSLQTLIQPCSGMLKLGMAEAPEQAVPRDALSRRTAVRSSVANVQALSCAADGTCGANLVCNSADFCVEPQTCMEIRYAAGQTCDCLGRCVSLIGAECQGIFNAQRRNTVNNAQVNAVSVHLSAVLVSVTMAVTRVQSVLAIAIALG